MERYIQKRGNYDVAYYTVEVDESMRHAALTFAKDIILTDNQYSRLLPTGIREHPNVDMQHKIEIQRTYVGKLGELAFVRFLHEKGKSVNVDGMFEIYEGQNRVDPFDFITGTGRLVDVKTGVRKIHKRLLVNVEQFDNIPKDYYVAVKLNADDVNPQDKLVDWNRISTAVIIGYAEYDYMKRNAGIRDFGEGPARWLLYDRLMGIDRILNEF